jgi:16S rRNA processing protein RimM
VSERLIPLGEVVATHGLEGWLKVNPFNPDTGAFEAPRELFLEHKAARRVARLEASRQQRRRQILIKLEDVDSIEAAEGLIGAQILATEESLPALQPGEYYQFQAIGLEVFDTNGTRLGTVSRIWSAGGRDIYVVGGNEKEYLIPAVKEIIEKFDFDAGTMVIDPPEGLLDL